MTFTTRTIPTTERDQTRDIYPEDVLLARGGEGDLLIWNDTDGDNIIAISATSTSFTNRGIVSTPTRTAR